MLDLRAPLLDPACTRAIEDLEPRHERQLEWQRHEVGGEVGRLSERNGDEIWCGGGGEVGEDGAGVGEMGAVQVGGGEVGEGEVGGGEE